MKFIGDAEKIKKVIKQTPMFMNYILYMVTTLALYLQNVCDTQFEYREDDNIIVLTALLKPTNDHKKDLQNFERFRENIFYDTNFKNNLLLNINIQWLTEDDYEKIKTNKENE